MSEEERDTLIEQLRKVLYSRHSSSPVVILEAREIMNRIPQRYHIKLTGEQYTSE